MPTGPIGIADDVDADEAEDAGGDDVDDDAGADDTDELVTLEVATDVADEAGAAEVEAEDVEAGVGVGD